MKKEQLVVNKYTSSTYPVGNRVNHTADLLCDDTRITESISCSSHCLLIAVTNRTGSPKVDNEENELESRKERTSRRMNSMGGEEDPMGGEEVQWAGRRMQSASDTLCSFKLLPSHQMTLIPFLL